MKKRYLIFSAMLIALVGASCSKQGFLDQTQSTDLNEKVVFSDSAYTINFLSSMYADIGFATWPKRFGGGGLDACTDEAEGTGLGSINTFIQFATGTVNSNMITKDAWSTAYMNIRRANIMLKNLPGAKFGDDIKVRVEAETRFLRAYYYFILLEHYGGVHLMGESGYDKEDQVPMLGTNSDGGVVAI